MKRLTIILFIAALGFAFTATLASAGTRYGFGYNGPGITVVGNFPATQVGFFSNFGPPPPPFFPFAPSKIHKRIRKNHYRCDCCYKQNKRHRSHHARYRKHHKRHQRDRYWDDYDDGRKNRSHRNRRNF